MGGNKGESVKLFIPSRPLFIRAGKHYSLFIDICGQNFEVCQILVTFGLWNLFSEPNHLIMATNNPFQPIMNRIPGPFRNRYFLLLVIFFAWMIFFDKHDVITQWKLQRTVNQLEVDKEYYSEQIEQAEQDRLDLELNKEKFARERYYMKKKNEEVFIMVEEED